MSQQIETIQLPIELGIVKFSDVNCYLVKVDNGYILIDTGISNKRADLEKALERAGCQPGNLKLIVLTHGDFDHTGNAAYLRDKYNAPIAMHNSDLGMVERGDMSLNRKARPVVSIVFRHLAPIFSVISLSGKFERFKPDFTIDEGFVFSEYGFDAQVIHIPGHSMGSIGILTNEGNLFSGDLFVNRGKPLLNRIMDDVATAKASVEKLKGFTISMIYPAHGKPFLMESFEG